jgi:Coenzyme PQQ synthesis protein D (PqqD)
MLDADLKPVARDDVQYSALDDGAVIYDTASERVHVLNSTAAYIWNLCDGSFTVEDIESEIEELARSGSWDIEDKVQEALTYFQKQGLLGTG